MVDESRVIKVICDGLGCMEYEELLEKLGVDDVENVIKNRDIFTVVQQNKSKKILVTSKIRRCKPSECQERCTDLHLCKFGLLGQCNIQRCKYGHSLRTEHNSRALNEHGLQDLNKDQLRVLLLQNDGSMLPNVCVSYNKGSGDFGNCPDKEACARLHVCERYIRGLCDGNECKRCHDFHEPHPSETLRARGVASHLIGSLLQIYQNILTLKDHRYARDKYGARSRENPKSQQPSNRAKVPESLQSSRAVNEICRSFIRGCCKYGAEKCWRVHFGLPYKWEVEVDEVWIDLPDNEVIERDYCDPAKIHSVGLEPVCFDTMEQGEHRVRRLSTVSSVIDPSFTHTTKWIWYWENEYHKWIKYGSIKEMHRLSSITCEEVEKNYLHFLEDNSHDLVKFTAGKQCYELNFRTMTQRNEMSNTERPVRRRPWFVSVFDARIARTRRGPNSYTGVPGFWDKTAVCESGYQRVLLDSSHKDFVRVQEHFNKTMKDFNILTVERVQNKELWEDFQTKRERMKKANSDKKYGEGERLLFHGTKTNNVDAICRQNFDMRVSGVNATVYGQGSYFAKDANYSNDYTDHYGERCMFACRVLVGQYTKGVWHYRRPPAKDAAGNLYDSCVNDVRNPTIYVVFERSQVYPEFLITYEKSSFPKAIDVIFDSVFDMSKTAESGTSTSSSDKAHITTSDSASTGEMLAAVGMPSALDSPPNPVKDVSSDSQRDDEMILIESLKIESSSHNARSISSGSASTGEMLAAAGIPSALDSTVKNDDGMIPIDTLDVILTAPERELSIQSKPTQRLTSLSRLLKESESGLRASDTNKDFFSSDHSLIAARPSLTDSSVLSGTDAYGQETFNLETERTSQRSRQDPQNSATLIYPDLDKSGTDSLYPIFCSSDKPKNFHAYSKMESETSSKTSSAQKQSLDMFSDIFDVNQTASELSTRSPQKEYITSSAENSITLKTFPVSSHSNDHLLSSVKLSATDKSIHYNMRSDLVTKQHDSPAARTGVTANFSHPLLSTTTSSRARNLSTNASSSAHNHSAKESKILTFNTPGSSSSNKQYCSDGSLSSSSVSFNERQPSAFSSIQIPSKSTSPQQASQQKKILDARREEKQKCRLQ
ncbi:protein mono-ADP-ribosyltransferase PARP12-like isoform X2 [Tachysurus fulvidraco]|uniref:protein mono-ADP-ribosyltransferase PARP12-like isoform X2 n=1 Tax=Tachysurus fulvidraco TaxID=1234273 RepID=UPI001FED436A|nr:protein mono-ADP-ribosyltransferase PARP12-like isoform X2 [Tachysurus fulvidraco]